MFKKILGYGKRVGKEMKEDRATGLAAEQAYYFMLAIFPLLILALSILPYLQIDPQRATQFIQNVIPGQTGELFREQVVNIVSEKRGGLLTFGIIGTIWSASNGMVAFIRAMNAAFDVDETRSFIKMRLIAIGLTFGLIIALIVTLVLPVFGSLIIDLVNSVINLPEQTQIIFQILRWLLAIAVIALVLSLLYKFAPNKHYPFKEVVPGAVVATIVWQLISLGFSFYVSNFGNYSATYGSLGGIIVLMLWFFLTGLTLVIGGEVNAVYHKRRHNYAETHPNQSGVQHNT
ncbi:YihY/virulence factor BrkB family protein [Pseudalkalibacillus caeni]|uniref:YihY/virulence factor BrkB family protein n=1 Tax=Exobacillus caeni TaxID=2574798 RepID=A0A5R9F5I8_9BACL|nr:YihY/virulence factor BrkB family protein [Pseudalkalibacillus caeni]TLS35075.1 YihY/virulence factor BrkB family protein [Pseudalkalibacillus caeni]